MPAIRSLHTSRATLFMWPTSTHKVALDEGLMESWCAADGIRTVFPQNPRFGSRCAPCLLGLTLVKGEHLSAQRPNKVWWLLTDHLRPSFRPQGDFDSRQGAKT